MNELNSVSDSDLMKHIADGTYTEDMVTDLTEKDKSVNQMKLFLLAQAKRELNRVIKLTEFLNKLEENYENKVMNNINDIDIKDFPTIISTITSCLSRSNDIIQKVLKDDSLTQLIFVDNSVNKNIVGTYNQLNLDSPDSRDRVNKVIKNVINIIDNYNDDSEEGEYE